MGIARLMYGQPWLAPAEPLERLPQRRPALQFVARIAAQSAFLAAPNSHCVGTGGDFSLHW